MKIAYLLGSLNRGGTETLLLDLFKNIRKEDFEFICFYRKTGVFEPDYIAAGKSISQLPVGKNPLRYLLRLRKALRQSGVRVVHAQQFIDAFYAYIACYGTGIKIIQTLHGYDYDNSVSGRVVLRFMIKRTDLNIYVSREIKEYYSRKFSLNSQRQKVVYNGLAFDKFHRQASSVSLRDELNVSRSALLLGTVGNFIPVRDPYTLCQFLKLLKEKGTDFHFVFAGKKSDAYPGLYESCVDFCHDNGLDNQVHFLGSRNDIPRLLTQLDAFLYSTDHDTFGIAVIEAIYAGIPVFVNNKAVMLEITENGDLATLYDTQNAASLLACFRAYLEQPEIYKQKALQASQKVSRKYSIREHILSLTKVYQDLLHQDS